MKILNLVQGSPEWQAARFGYNCASDAPAMMGASKRTTRTELLRMKATGDVKQFSEWALKLLEDGHKAEAAARPIVEDMIIDDLYPVTGADEDGLNVLASFDGITMAGDTGFEHKLWNEELAAAIRAKATSFPNGIEWQLEQQMLVGGLQRIIFVCSDGTKERFVWMEYRAVPGRAQQLLAGWKQFDEDVKAYQHVEVLPPPAGRVIPDLPALSIVLDGKVKKSNLVAFKTSAMQVIASINTNLQTDQDFADAAETVKFCENAEKKLQLAKESALAQAASIEEVFRTLDEVRETLRGKRLELDKLVEARKKAIRSEILTGGQQAFAAHIAGLNTRIGRNFMPVVPVDFAGAMKGKKSITSLRDAVDTELARAKIAANAIADKISVNLNALRDLGENGSYQFLFADLAQIALKEPDDFTALVKLRIAEHKDKEEKRLAEQRERIRAEEQAKAQAAPQPTAPAQAPQPAAAPAGKVVPLRGESRPTDDQIIAALADHYHVHESKVVEWLLGMDLRAASERLAAEFNTARGA